MMTLRQQCDFPLRVFLNHKSKVTGFSCVFKFFRRSLNGKHLMRFQRQTPFFKFLPPSVNGALFMSAATYFAARLLRIWLANEWCCFLTVLDLHRPCSPFEFRTISNPVRLFIPWWRHWRISQNVWRPVAKLNLLSLWKRSPHVKTHTTQVITRQVVPRKICFRARIIWRMLTRSFAGLTSEKPAKLLKKAACFFK